MHPNALDLTGQTFGRLTAVAPTSQRRNNNVVWRCVCSCGKPKRVKSSHLIQGVTRSCGCLMSESARSLKVGQRIERWTVLRFVKAGVWFCQCECGYSGNVQTSNLNSGKSKSCGCLRNETRKTHGLSHLREYKIWSAMRGRCQNRQNTMFKHYGGRGISVCRAWEDFTKFLTDVGYAPSPKHSLDRKNNDGNYEPGNVRWVTQSVQCRNKRSAKQVVLDQISVEELEAVLKRKKAGVDIFG